MKKFLIPVLVLAVIIVLGVVYFFSKDDGATEDIVVPNNVEETGSADEPSGIEMVTGSLKDMIARGSGLKCSYGIEGNVYEGYIKGANYKGSIDTAEGQTGQVIVKDNCSYTWIEGQSQGVKACYDESEIEPGVQGSDVWEQVDYGSDVVYNCESYDISESMFDLPSDVEFVDVNSMMEDLGY